MTNNVCIHRWLIGTANGPHATGVCSRCGDIREFRTYHAHDFNKKRNVTPAEARAIRIGRMEMAGYLHEAEKLTFDGHSRPNVIGRIS